MGLLPPSSASVLDTRVGVEPRMTAPLSVNIPHDLDDHQLYIILACAIAPVFSVLFVAARLAGRRCISRRLQVEDWISVATLLLCISYSVLLALWTMHGGGLHMDDLVRIGLEDEYYKWLYIASPSYILALMGYKVTIIILYLRLFMLQRKTVIASWIILFITVGYLTSNFITQLFGCDPISKFWDKYDPDAPGFCLNFVSADIAYGALNVITDFLIFVIPLPAVWLSGLARREKVGVSVVFLTGALAFSVALVRFQFAIRDLTAADRTFIAGDTMLWAVLEINTGLICSCSATLKPLWRRYFASKQLDRSKPNPGEPTCEFVLYRKPTRTLFSMPTVDEGPELDEEAAMAMADKLGSGGSGSGNNRFGGLKLTTTFTNSDTDTITDDGDESMSRLSSATTYVESSSRATSFLAADKQAFPDGLKPSDAYRPYQRDYQRDLHESQDVVNDRGEEDVGSDADTEAGGDEEEEEEGRSVEHRP